MVSGKSISTLKCVQKITGLIPDESFNISTDSRSYVSGEVFVALEGPTFNGVDFAQDLLQKGCRIFVCRYCENNVEKIKKYDPLNALVVVWVDDSIEFLHQLAKCHIEKWIQKKPKERLVIGITGSNGKTTYKEMLFHYLNSVLPGKVLATYKNFNNHIGLPRTIFNLSDQYDCIILEMGTNHFGEIKTLCDIAHPNVGVITNIGDAHLEAFKDRAGVFKEKRTLFDSVKQQAGLFLRNDDDCFLSSLENYDRLISFGEKSQDYKLEYCEQGVLITKDGCKDLLVNNQIVGRHNYSNLAACYILALNLFPGIKDTLLAVTESFTPKDGRSQWVEVQGTKVFYDAYNANPSSMRSSLSGFFDFCKNNKIDQKDCLVVLGDMNELGDQTSCSHMELGQFLKINGVSSAVFIGRYANIYQSGFETRALQFASTKEFKEAEWASSLANYQCIFLKGSRSLQLEKLIE